MFTRRTIVSLCLLFVFLLNAATAYAMPLSEEPIPPIPPLDDCYCVAEYQANMWRYHPGVPPTVAPEVPAILEMPINDCQDLAEYQANLWQLELIE
ncbi:MAG: hypothetical protein R2867_07340 [Caldilineaceae bacterium]|nr:hypothetical protein [Candidatus Saccharibacteria bacterium]